MYMNTETTRSGQTDLVYWGIPSVVARTFLQSGGTAWLPAMFAHKAATKGRGEGDMDSR